MATLFPEDVLLGDEAGFPTAAQEKVFSTNATEEAVPPKRTAAHPPPEKMTSPSARFILLVMVFLVMGLMTLATPVTNMDFRSKPCAEAEHPALAQPVADVDESSFARLLNTVSPDSLHDLLHRFFPKTYRHGVYPDDQAALEAVYRTNAPLATTLVKMAKRQDLPSNSTTTPPPDTSTTTETIPPTTTTETTTSPPDTTTDGPTTTEGSTTTSEPTSTSPPGMSTTSSPPPTSSFTSASTGSTSLHITKSPSKSLKPVTSTFTSTDNNGRPTVIIATSFVWEGPPTSTKPSGSLQTDAAALHNGGLSFKVFAGVLVGGVLLA